jgi:hypothetical protein
MLNLLFDLPDEFIAQILVSNIFITFSVSSVIRTAVSIFADLTFGKVNLGFNAEAK